MGLFDAIKGVAGAALGVVDGVVGGAVSDYFNRKAEKRQWKRDLTMWNMQNEYNSPAMQMERLRQAGLNPQLALGDVNTVAKAQLGGSASQSTNTGVGTLDLIKNPLAFENLKLATKQNEANVKQSEANVKNIEKNAELTNEKIRTEKENQESIRVNNENTRLANDVLRFKLASGILGDDSYSNMARSLFGFIGSTPDKMSRFGAGLLKNYSDHNESLNKEYSRLKAEKARKKAEKSAEKARKKAARKKHYEDTKKYLYNELQKQFSFNIDKYL